ncbi:MAG TPA: transporter substrate-binding domain-containing protein [Desulfatiglandales bacterium]|nr:transporter substrate-binding domain-containing protein [Desulfatiglandales bacterium]
MNSACRFMVAAGLAMVLVSLADAAGKQVPHGRTLVVGTKEAPPFSMKAADGTWTGISIDLWRDIAAQLNLAFEFRETDLRGLIDGVTDGSLDVAIAALTLTSEREKVMDFTHVFFHTGLGIAVSKKTSTPWRDVFRTFNSPAILKFVVGLFLFLLLFGSLIWRLERKKNPEQFGGDMKAGIISGLWWSMVTMSTVGYGDKAPITHGGRCVAFLWMLVSIFVISVLTAHITSNLTLIQMKSSINGPQDLIHVRVGSVAESTSSDYLGKNRIPFSSYKTASEGLHAMTEGKIQALVYDKPILQYLVQKDYPGKLEVLPYTLHEQDYGIALREGSPLREPINQVLLEIINSPAWQDTLSLYLGR